MSKDQTTQPTRRINLSISSGPNPPWTGQYFSCDECAAKYQLCASDECEPVKGATFTGFDLWRTPPCWTDDCGTRSVVRTPRLSPEGNPS